MTKLESHLEFQRQIVPWGYCAEFWCRQTVPPGALPRLAHQIMVDLIPRGQSLRNIKGADGGRNLPTVFNEAGPIPDGEILLLTALTPAAYSKTALLTADSCTEPIWTRTQSEFLSFPSPGTIEHGLVTTNSPDYPSDLPMVLLPSAVPYLLTSVRCSLELYSTRTLPIIGSSPIASRTLHLQATSSTLLFYWRIEGLKDKSGTSWQNDPYFMRASKLIHSITGLTPGD